MMEPVLGCSTHILDIVTHTHTHTYTHQDSSCVQYGLDAQVIHTHIIHTHTHTHITHTHT